MAGSRENLLQIFSQNQLMSLPSNAIMWGIMPPYGEGCDFGILVSNMPFANTSGYLLKTNNLDDVESKTVSFNNISPLTAKGDLVGFDGTNCVRLPVSTNGYVLTCDSTSATGWSWKQAGAGGSGPWSAGSGTNSAVGGDDTCVASGAESIAYGTNQTTASADYSIAFGYGCQALGRWSYAAGYQSVAQVQNTVAWGAQCTAHNLGSWVIADGDGDPASDQYPWNGSAFIATFAVGFAFYGRYAGTPIAICGGLSNQNVSSVSFALLSGFADQSYSYQTPSTGFSITIANSSRTLLLNPAGTLSSGTIIMPPNPFDGQEIRFSSSQIITTLTVHANSGQSIMNAPTTIAAGQGYGFQYNLNLTTWFRLY